MSEMVFDLQPPFHPVSEPSQSETLITGHRSMMEQKTPTSLPPPALPLYYPLTSPSRTPTFVQATSCYRNEKVAFIAPSERVCLQEPRSGTFYCDTQRPALPLPSLLAVPCSGRSPGC